ncbi:hypothetical protein QBC39DRAFT_326567 [Podospora conica]|nr:hypothetical protein QBC39DRAFT_326567 [Schizothecium conicum]
MDGNKTEPSATGSHCLVRMDCTDCWQKSTSISHTICPSKPCHVPPDEKILYRYPACQLAEPRPRGTAAQKSLNSHKTHHWAKMVSASGLSSSVEPSSISRPSGSCSEQLGTVGNDQWPVAEDLKTGQQMAGNWQCSTIRDSEAQHPGAQTSSHNALCSSIGGRVVGSDSHGHGGWHAYTSFNIKRFSRQTTGLVSKVPRGAGSRPLLDIHGGYSDSRASLEHGTASQARRSRARVPNFQTTANRGPPTTFQVHTVRGTSVPVYGRRVPRKYITANIEMKAILLKQLVASNIRGERDLGHFINKSSISSSTDPSSSLTSTTPILTGRIPYSAPDDAAGVLGLEHRGALGHAQPSGESRQTSGVSEHRAAPESWRPSPRLALSTCSQAKNKPGVCPPPLCEPSVPSDQSSQASPLLSGNHESRGPSRNSRGQRASPPALDSGTATEDAQQTEWRGNSGPVLYRRETPRQSDLCLRHKSQLSKDRVNPSCELQTDGHDRLSTRRSSGNGPEVHCSKGLASAPQ